MYALMYLRMCSFSPWCNSSVAVRINELSCWVAVASLAVPCGVLWCSDRIRERLRHLCLQCCCDVLSKIRHRRLHDWKGSFTSAQMIPIGETLLIHLHMALQSGLRQSMAVASRGAEAKDGLEACNKMAE